MALEGVNVGQELLNVPMGEMIRSMAMAIADAQWALDKSSMTVSELMSGQRLLRDLDTGKLIDFDGGTIEVDRRLDGTIVPKQYLTDAESRKSRAEQRQLMRTKIEGANPLSARIVDSRVYFGYTYVPERDRAGNIVEVTNADGEKIPRMIRMPNKVSMMELGFTPTFYQFVDTIIEVKIAIKITREIETTRTNLYRSQDATKRDLTVAEVDTNTRSWGWGHWWWRGHYSSSTTKVRHKKVGESTSARVSQVDASYSNKFGFSVEGSSLLRTKLVPVPPPAILEDRIRELMEQERDYQESIRTGLLAPSSESGSADSAAQAAKK